MLSAARASAIRSQLTNADKISAGDSATISAWARRSGPAARAVASTPATAQTASSSTVTSKKLPAPGHLADVPHQPGRGLHGPADQHRVLDRMAGIRHLAREESLPVVERVDIGVAGALELARVGVPGSGPARDFCANASTMPRTDAASSTPVLPRAAASAAGRAGPERPASPPNRVFVDPGASHPHI